MSETMGGWVGHTTAGGWLAFFMNPIDIATSVLVVLVLSGRYLPHVSPILPSESSLQYYCQFWLSV